VAVGEQTPPSVLGVGSASFAWALEGWLLDQFALNPVKIRHQLLEYFSLKKRVPHGQVRPLGMAQQELSNTSEWLLSLVPARHDTPLKFTFQPSGMSRLGLPIATRTTDFVLF
jgi:hypothetical protein